MRPDRIIGNTPRVGVEIEISRWEEQKAGNTTASWENARNKRAQSLVDAGLMAETPPDMHKYSQKYHTWNCMCWTCKRWEQHDADPYPVQFSLKYDGTLPVTGGEFISSPWTVNEANWLSFHQGWEIITESAVPDRNITNKQGNASSPSIHVHASCVNDDFDYQTAKEFRWQFAPEIILLSGASLIEPRSMHYRKMTSSTEHHHSFMNLQGMRAIDENGKYIVSQSIGYKWAGPHIELRTWEPEYDQPQYIEGAIYATAALAQIMSSNTVARKMIGLMFMRSNRNLTQYDIIDKPAKWDQIVKLVDMDIYRMLQHAMLSVTYAANDPYAMQAISWLFDEAAERWME